MKRVAGNPIVFDTGVEKIVYGSQDPMPQLPATREVAPALAPMKPRLDQLYPLFNLEDYIARQLGPDVNEAALLLPYRFDIALQVAVELLRESARKDDRDARMRRRALALLNDQVALRDLLRVYRTALLQG
jgi:type III secretion protein X